MDGQELVRIDLQLPASALDSLSRLAEQLRLLTDAVNGQSERAAQERGENTFFDAVRFQRLQPEAQSAYPGEPNADPVPAASVRASVTEEIRTPVSAGRETVEYREGPAEAAPPPGGGIPDAETAASDMEDMDTAQAVRKDTAEDLGAIPTVRPEIGQDIPAPPAAGPGAERRMPEADTEYVQLTTGDALPSPVREEVSSGTASPLGAGMVVTAEPDVPQSRWTGITEELVIPGPAPLTAESVSLAFQRDGRRYDNGFPLY